jgi:alkylation response protein AidB-like acyl-CoA dehydrogenase
MNLLPNDEQSQLVGTVRAFLDRRFSLERILGVDHSRFSPQEWRDLADLGCFGLGLSEEFGGVGLGPAEEMLIFTEFGRHLLGGPLLGSVLGAHAAVLVGDASTAASIVAGESTVGFLVERSDGWYLVDGIDAAFAIALLPERYALLNAEEIAVFDTRNCIDVAVDLQRVDLAKVPDARWITGTDGGDKLHSLGVILAAAFQVGLAQGALAQTLRYVSERHQFGQPIGGFQAIKHRCAGMAVQAEAAWSLTALAALSVDDEAGRSTLLTASAKGLADRVARFNAATNVQNHGGVGYTWEYGAHLFVSRAEVFGELVQPTRVALRAVLDARPA